MKNVISHQDSLLWKFYKPGSNTISYIYGTIHLRDKRVYFLIDKIKEILNNCDIFIAEYDLEDSGQPDIMHALQLPDNKHLKNYINSKKYDKLKNQLLKAFNIDIERFGFFKPMAIENMITDSMFESDYNFPMDFELWNYAQENSKIVTGAESTASQINIMKNLSIKKQINSLLKISQNTSKYRKKLNKIVYLYENQKLRLLYKNSLKSLGKLKKILVFDRNLRIADSFVNQSGDKSVLLAVGAGHLPGKHGVIRILKQKGFIVKPVLI
ncbi:MAG: TraB/GumN family protein [Saprospiraceae bacterium]|nr:TraB/GumN family protein [Saprospiraceae bacterium]